MRRLQMLVDELQASDPSDRLVTLLLGQLANLSASFDELQRMTAADPSVRASVLRFLEGLQCLRDCERQADEDARFLATAERVQ